MKLPKLYLLSFDPLSPTLDIDELHDTITGSDGIEGWAHYHSGCYFLTSGLSATEFKNVVRASFRAGQKHATSFVITEIGTDNMNGILPRQAWTWLQRRRSEQSQSRADSDQLQPAGE